MPGCAVTAHRLTLSPRLIRGMEESLFRGLLISHLAVAMFSMRANVIQSILFGIWNIVWPLQAFRDGDLTFGAVMSYTVQATPSLRP